MTSLEKTSKLQDALKVFEIGIRYSVLVVLALCVPQGVCASFFDEIWFYFCGFTLDQIDRGETIGRPMGGRVFPANHLQPSIQLASQFRGATQIPVHQQQEMHQQELSFGHLLGHVPQVLYS